MVCEPPGVITDLGFHLFSVMPPRFKDSNSEGTYVHLWLIHVYVWQKTAKFCKTIIIQLKNKYKK